jgi:hypothetical protein
VGSAHFYLTSLKLAPHETRAIDIRQLRDTQVADFKKNQIPAGAADGSVNWTRLDNVAISGRVVVISRSGAIASSYDCCYCSCPPTFAYVNISPYSIDLVPNGYVACSASAVYQDCNGNNTYNDVTGGATWWSSNPSVANMDGSVWGQVDGYAAGSATIYASWHDCTYDQSGGPCFCQVQTSTGSASATVCDFDIEPGSVPGYEVTVPCNGTEQAATFQAKPNPTSCAITGGSCSATASGNVQIAGTPAFSEPGGVGECVVNYFAGPAQANGDAGNITVTVNASFGFRGGPPNKSKSVTVGVACQ